MTDLASPSAVAPRIRHLGLLQAIAAFFIIVKIVYVFRVGPIADEAYYWMWGQHPDLSYFDHPPLQAWLLGISEALFGRSLIALRWMTLASLAGIFWIFHLWAKRLVGDNWQTLFWPGIVIYLASPTFGFFTSLAFHDYLLLFLCLASGHFFLNFLTAADAGDKPRHRDLYVAAFLLGLAGLTKYNAVFLGLGVFFYIIAKPSLRRLLADPHLYLAAAIAIGMQSPVIIWNLSSDFSSFKFHLADRHTSGWLTTVNWNSLIDFPAASAFLISPFLVPVFVRFFLKRHETRFEEVAKGLAIWVFWLSTATFILVSVFDWVFWWWNLVGYVLVMPFAAKHMGQRFLFYGHVVFGALVTLFLLISYAFLPLSILMGTPDWRQTRLYGWEELRDQLLIVRENYQPDFIASETPEVASVAGFALDDPNVMALTERITQFHYWWDKNAHVGQDAVVVLERADNPGFMASQFETFTPVGTIDITRFGYWINGFDFYYAENYQPTAPASRT
ncbi:MAG: glycosyltransferase family 39 protein [Devosia sp.]|nr:glycosyltransferase family 39 protein [Devosia sp.]